MAHFFIYEFWEAEADGIFLQIMKNHGKFKRGVELY